MCIMAFVFPLGILLWAMSRVRVHHHTTGPANGGAIATLSTLAAMGAQPLSLSFALEFGLRMCCHGAGVSH
jgi:hypothetical protein